MTVFAGLRLPREIVFGAGQRHALPAIARRLGERAFVCTDERFAATETFQTMIQALRAAGLEVHVFDRVLADVPRDSVTACIEGAASFNPQMVIGIGGGSCMDMAKCAALLLSHGGALQDYYGELKVPGPILPVIAVPTTAGTGSEVTPVAVVSDPDKTLKVGISSPHLIATAALCDPDLTVTCPPGLTAIAGADALTHAIEAYTTSRKQADHVLFQERVFVGKNELTDHFAMMAMRLLGRSLEKAVLNGADELARSEVMLGSLAAGCAFGTAGTAAAHAIQYPVGALTHTAHGLGVATVLPYVMTYNLKVAVAEFASIARILGLEDKGRTQEEMAGAAISEVVRLFKAIGITGSLADLGLEADKIEWTAQQALGIGRLINNNPRPLDLTSMRRLVEAAYHGNLAASAM
ncbi:iron-containing alcohol dehydrogenase [Neorhizobium sp. P12A]|uniref:iron-containing alcohol dehydrogenase n=1 Tax=Neorhizobium sp. P12A TaxID=2268027 RepID=UPI0011EE9D04|nr:iron-containing alcohol dehydrogenase [Neorhizobium sp. P12A]KAA0692051.1 iron-containing alcohol dehydrogenase [Neorhizobium sp. P12A]